MYVSFIYESKSCYWNLKKGKNTNDIDAAAAVVVVIWHFLLLYYCYLSALNRWILDFLFDCILFSVFHFSFSVKKKKSHHYLSIWVAVLLWTSVFEWMEVSLCSFIDTTLFNAKRFFGSTNKKYMVGFFVYFPFGFRLNDDRDIDFGAECGNG